MALRLVLLGPPGVGKGTVAKMLAGTLGLPHVSTGDLFREAVAGGTRLGGLAKGYMDRGELVPDELVIKMLLERFGELGDGGFILDGFPRTLPQAKALDEALSDNELSLDRAVYFEAAEDVIIDRLSGRRICRNCGAIYHVRNMRPAVEGVCDECGGELYQRSDDRPEAIKVRLKEHAKRAGPLLDYYASRGLLVKVGAEADAETTLARLEAALGLGEPA